LRATRGFATGHACAVAGERGAAGDRSARFEKLDMDLDNAAGCGLDAAEFKRPESTPRTPGCATSRQRSSRRPAALREARALDAGFASVRLPKAMWLTRSASA